MTDPVAQAAAVSAQVFAQGGATRAVLARADAFPDALGGSALAGPDGPLLFARAGGSLARPDPRGAAAHAAAGRAASTSWAARPPCPTTLEDELEALGFTAGPPGRRDPRGDRRRWSPTEVAAPARPRSRRRHGACWPGSANWPDAVTAGQLAARWGWPVLLTPPDGLAGG